ncbi:MAG: hypothetical protein JXA54_02785 [Candidatus Heimdallarchaeota archaeon]|nr:hypothetical protein [Candidatus Heimdallarchaeota archaeon]
MNENKQTKDSLENKPTITNEKEADNVENLSVHPEITRSIKKVKQERSHHIFQKVPISFVEKMNEPIYTHIILGLAVFFGITNITFGIFSILAIFGLNEENIWPLYEKMVIFGWEQLKITGFILIIIGIIMLWSVPYYFLNKTQQADSYLVIGSGICLLFGVIYLLIIFADIISAIVESVSSNNPIEITTYFYLPIMLALITFPLFRVLVVRHMIVLPDLLIDDDEVNDNGVHYYGRSHSLRKWGENYHKHYHERGRRFRGKKWRDWDKK